MKNTLILVDIQKEYIANDRPFFIENISDSLKNCKKVLEHARANEWQICHVRHLQSGEIFNSNSHHSDYIEDFAPLPSEKEFIKSNFSCFSLKEFTKYMDNIENPNVYIIGYGSSMCCLSTIIDGYHRGFKINFVSDASAAKKGQFDEITTHEHCVDIISTFAEVIKTENLVLS
ncbi:MAG: cysteine hydrolase [Desulfobacteraceae bacterium]|nr:cysteine hydrolase [Desulfobacteraceae bacterium]